MRQMNQKEAEDRREPVCYIVGAGEFGDGRPELHSGDFLIAADAGWKACRERSLPVDLLIGDFDSMAFPASLQGPEEGGEPEVLRLPVEKDDTDMRAAVREGWKRGYRRFVLYGGAGGARTSHTLANIQLLAEIAEKGGAGCMIGRAARYTVIRNGSFFFPAGGSGDLSVFSLSDRSEGVTITGAKYLLQDAVLTNRFPLGVSNSFTGRAGAVSVREGTLLILEEGAVAF